MVVAGLAVAMAPPDQTGIGEGYAELALPEPDGPLLIRIYQESAPGSGDFSLLGTISPYQCVYPAGHSYGYNGSLYAGCYLRVNTVPDRSLLFFAMTEDGMSLLTVHDMYDANGGSAEMRFDVLGDPNGAWRSVEDDPDDYYTGEPGETVFTSSHWWVSVGGDGQVISGLNGRWMTVVQFTEVDDNPNTLPIAGLSDWMALSSDGTEVFLDLVEGQRAVFQVVSTCEADINADGDVGTADLLAVLSAWGECE